MVLVVATLFVLIPMLRLFFTPILLACTFAALFYPLFSALLGMFRGNRALASLASCLILVLVFVIPLYFLGYLVMHQIATLYQSAGPFLHALVKGEPTGIMSSLRENPLFSMLSQVDVNWRETLLGAVNSAGATAATIINRTSLGALEILIGLFVTLFIIFYLFMDGERIVSTVRQLIPLRPEYVDMIIARFHLVSRATVKGTLVIASIQGSMGAIILLVFGVKSWLLWGLLMTALACIPMFGAWMILVPAGIIQLAAGNMWQGLVILGLSFGVVSTIDNILRPRLVGQNARMHDLLVFFSSIGGIATFGPVGIITGPVIMAFFVSITEIYTLEMKEHLEAPQSDDP
jgi:predicted PurR-regulated permease PerM